jgi:hypothetical protein
VKRWKDLTYARNYTTLRAVHLRHHQGVCAGERGPQAVAARSVALEDKMPVLHQLHLRYAAARGHWEVEENLDKTSVESWMGARCLTLSRSYIASHADQEFNMNKEPSVVLFSSSKAYRSFKQ